MTKHTSILMASLFVASLFVTNDALANGGTSRYQRPATYVPVNINQKLAKTKQVLKAIGTSKALAGSQLHLKAVRSAFGNGTASQREYLLAANVDVMAVKLRTRKTGAKRKLTSVEVSATVKSPAGNRERSVTVKVKAQNDRMLFEELAAAVNVEFKN